MLYPLTTAHITPHLSHTSLSFPGCCMATRSRTSLRVFLEDFLPCSCCKAPVVVWDAFQGHREAGLSSSAPLVKGCLQTHTPPSLPGFSMPTRSTVYGQMPSRTCRTSHCSHSMTTRSRAWPKARSPPCGPSRLCECPHQLPWLGRRASGGKASPGLELVITHCSVVCHLLSLAQAPRPEPFHL